MQNEKTWYKFNRIKLFIQKIISWLALSLSCNRMRLSHVNSTSICKFLALNCAIFTNKNLVEITLPQNSDRFGAVVYGKFFIVNWIDFIIKRIRSTGMVKRECIRFIFISSQISSFCGCQTDFLEFIIIKPHWVKLFLTNSASSRAKFFERVGREAAPKPSSKYVQTFISSFLQNFVKL